MKKNILFVVCLLAGIGISLVSFAEQSTSAVMSPKCDEVKLKEIAGDALVSIVPTTKVGDAQVYNITLELTKMTFTDLTKKMQSEGCF